MVDWSKRTVAPLGPTSGAFSTLLNQIVFPALIGMPLKLALIELLCEQLASVVVVDGAAVVDVVVVVGLVVEDVEVGVVVVVGDVVVVGGTVVVVVVGAAVVVVLVVDVVVVGGAVVVVLVVEDVVVVVVVVLELVVVVLLVLVLVELVDVLVDVLVLLLVVVVGVTHVPPESQVPPAPHGAPVLGVTLQEEVPSHVRVLHSSLPQVIEVPKHTPFPLQVSL